MNDKELAKKVNDVYEMTKAAREEQMRFTPMILYVVGFGAAAMAAMALVLAVLAIRIL